MVPGFNVIASDQDTEPYAHFTLEIQDADQQNPGSKAFAVTPEAGVGRVVVGLKVLNSDLLDYEQERRRLFHFNIVATQGDQRSTCAVTLIIADANDNSVSC